MFYLFYTIIAQICSFYIVDKTIDKTIVNDSTENETNKFGLGKHVVIWD
jgi:hypothetical protein